MLVTRNTKAWRNATQTNIANKLPIQFSHAENIAVPRNDPASTFHQTFPSPGTFHAIDPSLLPLTTCSLVFFFFFSFLFFVLNEDGERVWRELGEILGSWEGRRCLPFLSGEGGGFYFPEKRFWRIILVKEYWKLYLCTYIYSVGFDWNSWFFFLR